MLELLVALILADFFTGLIHWWEDTYADPSWPLLGPLVATPNIRHHEFPSLFTTAETLFSRNYLTVVPAAAICLGIWWAIPNWWPLAAAFALASFGNEVHAWNHRSDNPWWIKVLQDSGIMQSPKQHAKHHRAPYDSYYCTLTNFANAILEPIRFWRRLEWFIGMVLGIWPKRGMPERRGY